MSEKKEQEMSIEDIQDLFDDAERSMLRLLPPEQFGEHEDADVLHQCLTALKKIAEQLRQENETLKAMHSAELKMRQEEFKKITGHNTPVEWDSYEKGREDEQEFMMMAIDKWDGSTNSALGQVMHDTFKRLQQLLTK